MTLEQMLHNLHVMAEHTAKPRPTPNPRSSRPSRLRKS
jgi:hypothetical protein